MRPQRLHPRRGYGLLRRPRGQVCLHALGAAFHEDALRLRLIIAILREQPVEQRRVIQFSEISPGQRRTPLGRDTPDAAVLLVAPRIAKIHFTVLDDRVAPIGEIQRAVGPELHVERTKRAVRGPHHIGHFLCDVGRALVGNLEAHHAVCPEIRRNHVTLPIVRKLRAPDNFETGKFRVSARAHALQFSPRRRQRPVGRPQHRPAHPGTPGSVGSKRLPKFIKLVAP